MNNTFAIASHSDHTRFVSLKDSKVIIELSAVLSGEDIDKVEKLLNIAYRNGQRVQRERLIKKLFD